MFWQGDLLNGLQPPEDFGAFFGGQCRYEMKHMIDDPLSPRVFSSGPQFKVFWAVVGTDSVFMVDVFITRELSA
jgi:hypothetical protein